MSPTGQRELREVVARVRSAGGQQGYGGVRHLLAVGQVQSLQLGHVSLHQPQAGVADVQAGQAQRQHVPQPAAGRLRAWTRDGHILLVQI